MRKLLLYVYNFIQYIRNQNFDFFFKFMELRSSLNVLFVLIMHIAAECMLNSMLQITNEKDVQNIAQLNVPTRKCDQFCLSPHSSIRIF